MRRWAKRLALVLGIFSGLLIAVYTLLWVVWNDEAMGRSVSGWASGTLRGNGGPSGQAFVIRSVHYPWNCHLRSILAGGGCPFDAYDIRIYDADGKMAVDVPHARGSFHTGAVVWNILGTLLHVQRTTIELHFDWVEVDTGGKLHVALTPRGAVNLVEAFSQRLPRAPTTDDGGGIHLTFDDARLHGIDLTFALPGWIARAPSIDARVRLRYSSFAEENQDKDRPAFTYDMTEVSAPGGELRLLVECRDRVCTGDEPGAFHMRLADLAAERVWAPQDARDELRFRATTRVDGAPAKIDGKLYAVYSKEPGADLIVSFEHGRELVKLPRLDFLGGDPHGVAHFHGPFSHFLIDADLYDADLALAGVAAHVVSTHAHLEGSRVGFDPNVVDVGGGRVTGGLLVDLGGLSWSATLHAEGVDPARLAPLVPPSARPLLAGRLDGGARVGGSLNPLSHPERVRVSAVDARLARRGRDLLPRELRLRGGLVLSPGELSLDNVTVSGDGVDVSARGSLDLQRATADAAVTVVADDLEPLLRRLGLPVLADDLAVDARVTGPLVEPTARGRITVHGLGRRPLIAPVVDGSFTFEHGRLHLGGLRAEALGGIIGGGPGDHVELGLWDGSFRRALDPPRLTASLTASGLRLERITGFTDLRGAVAGRFTLEGPLGRPLGNAVFEIPSLTLFGDPYHGGSVGLRVGAAAIEIGHVALERDAGGRLFGQGRIGWDGGLGVTLTALEFPLAALPPLRGLPVAGTISGRVTLGGDLSAWRPSGNIDVAGVRLREFHLGDGRVTLIPGGDAIRLQGEFFDRFHVDGYLTLQPTLAVNVAVTFADLPLDELIPELRELADIKGLVSGEARLSYGAGRTPFAELRLDKVVLTLRRPAATDAEDAAAGAAGLADEFRNDGAIVLTSDFERLVFRQARLRSPNGDVFTMLGEVAASYSRLRVEGRLNLALLQYFTSSLFDQIRGDATVNVTITGPVARPKVLGTVELRQATLQPRGARRPFQASGLVIFEDRGITVPQIELALEGRQLRGGGSLELKSGVPGDVAFNLNGELPAEMLQWFWDEYIAEVDPAGRFQIDASVRGRWDRPTWRGTIDVRDVAMRLRIGRDLRVAAGTVILQDYDVTLGCPRRGAPPRCRTVAMRLDDTGDVRLDGTVRMRGLALERVDLSVDGDNLEWSSGRVYSVTLSPQVSLTGTGKRLRLAGDVYLVTGTYRQDFDEKEFILQPRTVESEPPFYAGIPLLENLDLDLNLTSSGPLVIRNNLAERGVQMTVSKLRLGGTLAHPNLDGTVAVEEGGAFKIPFLTRVEFITDRSIITFNPRLDFPDDTPSVDINASADWTDRYEQPHHIVLKIAGTYREPKLDLWSTDGWDKQQVLAALATGGSADQLRRAAGVEASGDASRSGTPTILQTASGDLLLNFAEDPIKRVFGLDTLRLELGYVRGCKYNRRTFKLCGTAEGQLAPTSNYDLRAEVRLSDDIGAFIAAQRLERSIERSAEVINRVRLQLRWRFPFY